jgi:hypothetical protein
MKPFSLAVILIAGEAIRTTLLKKGPILKLREEKRLTWPSTHNTHTHNEKNSQRTE